MQKIVLHSFKGLLFIVASLCLPVFTVTAQTVKTDPIDIEYAKCLGNDTSCVTISDCAFIAYDKWNKEMDHTYKKLLSTLKKEKDKTAFKQSQTAWVAYRDATFKAYDNMFDLPGNKWCKDRHEDRIAMVRERTMQLRSYIASFKKK